MVKRRVLGLLFALIICVSGAGAASAAENAVEPYWVQLLSIQCSLTASDSWFSNSHVNAEARCKSASYDVKITVSILKKDGSQYVDTGISWTDGPSAAANVDKKFSLDPGNYIARCVAVVTDSAGRVVETVTKDSYSYIVS